MAEVSDKTIFTRKKRLQAELEHVNQQMYARNLELAETNKALSLLRTIDTLTLESHEGLEVLAKQIAQSIAVTADFPFAAIFINRPRSEHLELMGWHLPESAQGLINGEQLNKLYIDTDTEWIKGKDTSMMVNAHNLHKAEIAKYLHLPAKIAEELLKAVQLDSIFVGKLTARQRLVGLMVIGLSSSYHSHSSGPSLFDRLSQAVGVAVDNRLLYEENQRIVQQLQRNNEKLKALDEAKDEFISMASHQLRTPLTSMKGYVSMVLEGDGGKPSKMQKKLLGQAFASSQRMVYLIADLLNVSRLKTGKFVIEPVSTNLAEVVESELEQLKESAKSRNLTLTYKKPKKFPTLMLDETKTRQVIMNFADNAIYYTPAGGHINVNLEDKGKSIEFTVVDDGIGVPKSEQAKLFGKFFRAGNARNARPDGTGLGLFMAKKVVVAQGGAIIFKSTEGKGSIFGFSFPKVKLQIKDSVKNLSPEPK